MTMKMMVGLNGANLGTCDHKVSLGGRISFITIQLDTKANGEYLRKCIFDGPYKLTSIVIEAVTATVNAPACTEHDEADDNDIYSAVDACNTAIEMGTAMKDYKPCSEGYRICKDCGTLCKVFQEALQYLPKTTFELLQTPGTRLKTPHQGYNRVNQSGRMEAHYSFMAKIQEVLPEESSSTDQPLEQVDQNAAECVDERAALANLIANLTLDTEENKMILKQLKKANASLTLRIEECRN
ncbi:hypothetical protein Tco_1571081 [Tanacetum coccineum]